MLIAAREARCLSLKGHVLSVDDYTRFPVRSVALPSVSIPMPPGAPKPCGLSRGMTSGFLILASCRNLDDVLKVAQGLQKSL